MTTRTVLGAIAGLAMVLGHAVVATAGDASRDPRVEHGRYLVTIGGCNDCHTAGYPESGGKIPEKEWLTGVPVGFQGPWGPSYPANLRRVVSGMSEAEWVVHARKERMPPMPWFNLRVMTDSDLAAIYAFIRSLGAAGAPMPAYVGPGGKVDTPYIVFVPVSDRRQAAAR